MAKLALLVCVCAVQAPDEQRRKGAGWDGAFLVGHPASDRNAYERRDELEASISERSRSDEEDIRMLSRQPRQHFLGKYRVPAVDWHRQCPRGRDVRASLECHVQTPVAHAQIPRGRAHYDWRFLGVTRRTMGTVRRPDGVTPTT